MRLKEVLKLPLSKQEEYFWYTHIAKPKDSFKVLLKTYKSKPVTNFSFKDVDYIKRLFFQSDISSMLDILIMQYDCKINKFLNMKIELFISILKKLQDEIETILKEEEKLDFFNDEKVKIALKMSNAKVMNQFGIYNSINSLAGNNKKDWEYFEDLPYYKVKFMLTFDTVSNSVNKKFEKNYNDLLKLEK